MPKVLSQCGHTFCERCILQLWDHSVIPCPFCRQKARINNAKDLPQTNFALLRMHAQIKDERKAKTLVEKYRVINPKGYLDIEEIILREHTPTQLSLYGIYEGGELIYKEKVPDSNTVRLRLLGIKKYSFNKHSFLQNYFFMNEQSRYLFFFRKFTMCRHKYSCFEHVIRTLYKTVGLYLILRTGMKFMF